MERFFIITDESRYKKDYIAYKENIKKMNDLIKEFFNENEIETSEYYVTEKQLYIIPNENDVNKFDKLLNKPIQQGLRGFKKSSKINKAFLQKLKDNDIKVLDRSSLWMYINGFYGNMSTTTCLIDGVMYLKLSTTSNKEINEKGFTKIKGSEYYAAIENME